MIKKQNKHSSKNTKIDHQVHDLVTKIDANPQDPENYLQLATILIEQSSFDQATKLLEEAKHLVKKPQDLDYDLAVCYYMQGEFNKALTLLKQIPNDDLVLYQKALVFLKLGQRQKALAHALTIKHVDDRVNELIGDIWLSLGELKEAKSSYEKIGLTKRSAKVNFMLGITILAENRSDAKRILAISKKQDPKFFKKAQEQYGALLKMINDAGKKNG